MSFSFNVRGATLALAIAAVAASMKTVVEQQPNHAHDEANVNKTAEAMGSLLGPVPEDKDVVFSVNGSLGWNSAEDGSPQYTAASIGCSVYVAAREPQPA